MGILLGLATALSWGIADFCARFATRSVGTFRTMLYMQLTGFLLLTVAMHWLTMMLSAITGERLTVTRFAGVALIIGGVVMVAHGEQAPGDAHPLDEPRPAEKYLGVGWAVLSAVAFGVMFWLLGTRAVPQLGAAPSVWLIRLTSVLATALVMLSARQPMKARYGRVHTQQYGNAA